MCLMVIRRKVWKLMWLTYCWITMRLRVNMIKLCVSLWCKKDDRHDKIHKVLSSFDMPKSLATHTPPLFIKSTELYDSGMSPLRELSRAAIILLNQCSVQYFSPLYKFTAINGKSSLKFNFPTATSFVLMCNQCTCIGVATVSLIFKTWFNLISSEVRQILVFHEF